MEYGCGLTVLREEEEEGGGTMWEEPAAKDEKIVTRRFSVEMDDVSSTMECVLLSCDFVSCHVTR